MLKSELRKHVRELKRQYSEEQLRQLSEPIIEALMADKHIKEAKTLLLYYSLPDEVFTHSLCDKLLERGLTVLLPVVIGEGEMRLRRYEGRQSMKSDRYNIMEPQGPEYADYRQIDTAIVPGMAFDNRGNRLGRGKGYYDRFLPKIPQAFKIGLCFHFQMVESVPSEATDIMMDKVICGHA